MGIIRQGNPQLRFEYEAFLSSRVVSRVVSIAPYSNDYNWQSISSQSTPNSKGIGHKIRMWHIHLTIRATTMNGRNIQQWQEGQKGQNQGRVSTKCDCPLNILPLDLWVRIASIVALGRIQDIFNMQAICTVFLDAARSPVVYKVASLLKFPIASYFYYIDCPEKSFLYRCANTGNPSAMFQ
ncbi:hypothetical protein Ahy_A03g013006 [Arachis hypogaea]|uniref:F-box domain-containing protein n=1 Tax=Arachis hypogaea TaxID=3818 RepID=A0A445DUI9_ARAHY|nr:hypothetical protein Ahy_A03g013006 [Arachis hypogaea]